MRCCTYDLNSGSITRPDYHRVTIMHSKRTIMRIHVLACLTFSFLIIGCNNTGTDTFDLPPCQNPEFTLTNGEESVYSFEELNTGSFRIVSYYSSFIGSGAYSIDKNKTLLNPLIWQSCGENNVSNADQLVLSGKGYINSLEPEEKIQINMNVLWCFDENITVTAGTFESSHCQYMSDDGINSYESYVINEDDDARPMGGLIYYIGYKNDIQNYVVELISWNENSNS